MEDPRATVLKLIAYVTDPVANENEAREMAMQVCRIIKKHGLLDSSPVPEMRRRGPVDVEFVDLGTALEEILRGVRARPRRPPPPPTRETVNPFGAEDRGTAPNVHDFIWEPVGDPGDPFAVYPQAAPPPQPSVPGERARRAKDPEAKLIPILQPAYCPGCHQKIRYGTYGMWSRGEVWHGPCLTQATEGT